MTCASKYLNEGYNCAESLIKFYNDEYEQNIPLGLGSGMGAGATIGSLCGAINAGIVIIGFVKGRTNNIDYNLARNYSKEFITKIKEKYSTEICRNLKANKVNCSEIVDFSYNALIDILKS